MRRFALIRRFSDVSPSHVGLSTSRFLFISVVCLKSRSVSPSHVSLPTSCLYAIAVAPAAGVRFALARQHAH